MSETTSAYHSFPDILIVVDMQKDFVTGSLGTEDARTIVPNVVKRITEGYEHHKYDKEIIYTRDTHYNYGAKVYSDHLVDHTYERVDNVWCMAQKYQETFEGMSLPVEHCIVGTPGHDIIPEITELWDKYDVVPTIVDKYSYGSIVLPQMIENDHYDPGIIEVLGLVTDCCVLANAIILRNYFPNTKIQINSQCCADSTPAMHQAALDILKLHQIEII